MYGAKYFGTYNPNGIFYWDYMSQWYLTYKYWDYISQWHSTTYITKNRNKESNYSKSKQET